MSKVIELLETLGKNSELQTEEHIAEFKQKLTEEIQTISKPMNMAIIMPEEGDEPIGETVLESSDLESALSLTSIKCVAILPADDDEDDGDDNEPPKEESVLKVA